MKFTLTVIVIISFTSIFTPAQDTNQLLNEADGLIKNINAKVIEIRRDIHANAELGNREFRTSKLIAEYLTKLGMEVKTGIAHTGVIGILKGNKKSPVVALRSEMDALPVTEDVDVPFASKVKTNYNGQETGVMHACGHDAHMAILLGVAEVLSKIKDKLPGTVMFIFQPAEEGAPTGEEGGAKLMLKEGLFDILKPDAIFALHTWGLHTGTIAFKEGTMMASSDFFSVNVKGKGTHGAMPWGGVDPVTVSAQIILGLQNIISRQIDITKGGGVITIGSIHGGIRQNIIPDNVEMKGTIRALDDDTRLQLYDRIKRTAENIALSAGATANVVINTLYPMTINDNKLTAFSESVLNKLDGVKIEKNNPVTVAEDFSFFQQKIPGFYFLLGVIPPNVDLETAPRNHSPRFFVDENSFPVGMKALTHLVINYLSENQKN